MNTKAHQVIWGLVFALVLFQTLVSSGVISFDTSSDFIPIEWSDDPAIRAQQLENMVLAADAAASALFAMHIGLFVLVGFTLSMGYRVEDGLSTVVAILLAAFVLSSFVTLYVGYLARFQVVERTTAAHLDFAAVQDTIALQGFLLGVSATLAIATSAVHLVQPRLRAQAAHDGANKEERKLPTPPPAPKRARRRNTKPTPEKDT